MHVCYSSVNISSTAVTAVVPATSIPCTRYVRGIGIVTSASKRGKVAPGNMWWYIPGIKSVTKGKANDQPLWTRNW